MKKYHWEEIQNKTWLSLHWSTENLNLKDISTASQHSWKQSKNACKDIFRILGF